jgi:hypothetical protein
MAIKNIAKAESLLRTLAEELKIRTAGSAAGFVDTVREARDTEGYPFIVLSDNGNEAAAQPVLFIRIKQIDAISKDIFGNDLKAYAPHVCELAYELNTGNQAFVAPLDITKVMFELAKLGVKLQVKQLANGTAVTAANVDAASTALELDWLRWPTKGV